MDDEPVKWSTRTTLWDKEEPKVDPKTDTADEGVSWSDWAREAAAATTDLGAGLATGVDVISRNVGGPKAISDTATSVRDSLNRTSDDIRSGLSESAQKARDATFNPWGEGPTVYGEGIGRSVGMKFMSALPSLAMSVLPAGLVARGAMALGAGRAAAVTAAGVTAKGSAATMNAGDVANQIYKEIEKLSDDELVAHSDTYRGLLSMMPPDEAREMFMAQAASWRPVVAGAITYLTGGFEGQLGKRLGGDKAVGFLAGTKKGAIAELPQEFAEALSGNMLTYDALRAENLTDEAWSDALLKALPEAVDAGIMGGIIGGVAGGVSNIDTTRAPRPAAPAQPASPGTPGQTSTARPRGVPPAPPTGPTGTTSTPGPPPGSQAGTTPPTVPGASATPPPKSTVQDWKDQFGSGSATVAPEVGPDPAQAATFTVKNPPNSDLSRWGETESTYPLNPPIPQPQRAPVPDDPFAEERAVTAAGIDQPARILVEPDVPFDSGPAVPASDAFPGDIPDNDLFSAPTTVYGTKKSLDPNRKGWPKGTEAFAEPVVAPTPDDPRTMMGAPTPAPAPAPLASESDTPPGIGPKGAAVVDLAAKRRAKPKVTNKKETTTIGRASEALRRGGDLVGQDQARVADDLASAGEEAAATLRGNKDERDAAKAKSDDAIANMKKVLAETKATNDKLFPPKAPEPAPKASPVTEKPELGFDGEPTGRKELWKDGLVVGIVDAKGNRRLYNEQQIREENTERFQQQTAERQKAEETEAKEKRTLGQAISKFRNKSPEGKNLKAAQAAVDAAKKAGAPFAQIQALRKIRDAAEVALDKAQAVWQKEYQAKKQEPAQVKSETATEPEVEEDKPDPVKQASLKELVKTASKDPTIIGGISISEDSGAQVVDAILTGTQGVSSDKGPVRTAGEATEDTGRKVALDREATEAALRSLMAAQAKEAERAKSEAITGVKAPTQKTESKPRGDDVQKSREATRAERIAAAKEVIKAEYDSRGVPIEGAMLVRQAIQRVDREDAAKAKRNAGKVKAGDLLARGTEAERKARAEKLAAEAALVEELTTESPPELDNVVEELQPKAPKPLFSGMKIQNAPVPDSQAQALQVMTTSELLDRLPMVGPGDDAAQSYIFREMKERIRKRSGDVPVYILDDANMDRLLTDWGHDTSQMARLPAGFYEPSTDAIYLHGMTLAQEGLGTQLLMHESMHAIFQHALDNDFQLQTEVRDLIELTRAQATREGKDISEIYGLKHSTIDNNDVHEFLAEAFSNADFQRLLARTRIPPKMMRPQWRWGAVDNAWNWVVFKTRELLGLDGDNSRRAIDAVIRIVARAEQIVDQNGRTGGDSTAILYSGRSTAAVNAVKGWASEFWNEFQLRQSMDTGPALAGLRSFDNLARAADPYFGDGEGNNNPVRFIQEARERMRVDGQDRFNQAEPIISKLYELQKKYEATGEWKLFTDLSHDANMLDVHPDVALTHPKNAHVVKTMRGAQARAAHADMRATFNALPAEMQQAWHDATTYFRDQQNEMTFMLLKNRVLKALTDPGMSDADLDALARRFFEGKETDDDKKAIGTEAYDGLKRVDQLRQIKGPYMPQMRRGDYVSRGKVPFTKPTNARAVPDESMPTFAFEKRDEAEKYAAEVWERDGLRATIQSMVVDAKTGNKYFIDDDGTPVRASLSDMDAKVEYRVAVQDEYMALHDSAVEAQAAVNKVTTEYGYTDATAEPKRWQDVSRADLTSEGMRSLMKRIEQSQAYKGLGEEQRKEVVSALHDMSFQMLGATRVQSRRLPRRAVQGASRDLTHNTMDYARSVSGYLAKLKEQPGIDAALKEMRDQIERGRTREYSQTAYARQKIANEVAKRLSVEPQTALSGMNPVLQRILTISFLDKLASPAHSIINSTQFITNTVPLLAGQHGWGATTAALTKAWSTMGGNANIAAGAKNTVRGFKGKEAIDLLTPLRARVAAVDARYGVLVDKLVSTGRMDADAGMEVVKAIRTREGITGKIDTVLSIGERIARAMPTAIEINNRMATALATFDLELTRGATQDQAMQRAMDMVDRTQFNYSPTNAPAFMNHPLARLTLQFKKYAQGQYQLLGELVGTAIRNEKPGDRAVALKSLANYAAVITAFAGVLGLPTEPIKYLLLGTSWATGISYEEFERRVRETADNLLGNTLGTALTRGVTRAIPGGFGFDLSSRMGVNDLTSFGEPRTQDEAGWKTWIFNTLAGAPAGLVTDYVKGAGHLMNGDPMQAAEKLIPIKTVADVLASYRMTTEGKISQTSKRQTMEPYAPQEAVIKALGFQPAREAQTFEKQNSFYDRSGRAKQERQKLVTEWLTGTDKGKAWARIQKWNEGRPKDAQISMKDLQTAAKRRRTEEKSGVIVDGIRTTKQDRHYLEGAR